MTARLLTIREAAPLLGLTEVALRHRVERGQVPYKRLGGSIRIQSAWIDALVGDVIEPARTDRPRHLTPVEPDPDRRQVSA